MSPNINSAENGGLATCRIRQQSQRTTGKAIRREEEALAVKEAVSAPTPGQATPDGGRDATRRGTTRGATQLEVMLQCARTEGCA